MLHVLESKVFIQGRGDGGGGTRPPLSEFSGSAPEQFYSYYIQVPFIQEVSPICTLLFEERDKLKMFCGPEKFLGFQETARPQDIFLIDIVF